MPVAIIDSGGANLGSVAQACKRLGVEATLTHDAETIQAASHVILPGVGTAQAAMETLEANGLVDVISGLTQPVLGICLGLQLLFECSTEGDSPVPCLGIIPGDVTALPVPAPLRLPHMGWNQLSWVQDDPISAQLTKNDWFYFVHSFGVAADSPATVATCEHGVSFAAVVRYGNFVACQFHPEKSAGAGERLMRGFLAS